ncbi:hypothetical protein DFQ27_000089 [Actinomortierella ambigua]|uniref:Uncharacterized protein n=1 Tax=Actinomortierella ambigua TaxID=1343610 RepID=A0A9P6QNX6_9FUNG|nr:hypothetical protein DFQ27_000089 [Actinomortierella ambigua]
MVSILIAGLAAFESFLWIVQSRVYENGRPSLQEIVLSVLFSAAYLFSAAWQFYQAYKDSSASGFLCSTHGHDELVDCRLWQAGLVGSATCGFAFLFIAILWTCLFRRRHNISEDLPGDLTPEITSEYVKEGNSGGSREDAAAIAAEAERRQMLHRQKQQQDHRQMTLPSLGHTPTPPANPAIYPKSYYNPNYYATTQPFQPPMTAYQHPHQQFTPTGYPNAHFGGNYAYNGNTTPMTQDYGRSGTPVGGGGHPYSEEPSSYFNASQYYATPEGTHPYSSSSNVAVGYGGGVGEGGGGGGIGGASGVGAAASTAGAAATTAALEAGVVGEGVQVGAGDGNLSTTDIHAQALAHREYANQLKQQQSYHENMAEALNRHAQSQRQGLNSGSTAPVYPAPPHSRGSLGGLSAVGGDNGGGAGGIVSSRSGDGNYTASRQSTMPLNQGGGLGQGGSRTNLTAVGVSDAGNGNGHGGVGVGGINDRSRPSTPGSARPVHSPQQYHSGDPSRSEASLGYADDNRYREELLDEIRRQRQDEFEGRSGDAGSSGGEAGGEAATRGGGRPQGMGVSSQDYKVPIV